jgi:hypothetical protein
MQGVTFAFNLPAEGCHCRKLNPWGILRRSIETTREFAKKHRFSMSHVARKYQAISMDANEWRQLHATYVRHDWQSLGSVGNHYQCSWSMA